MADKSIIIIGAGITGLSAGCYGQMNSYRTRIFEMHNTPGGLCTSWQRSGYTIDGCLHWFLGSAPRSNFYQIWEELGAVQTRSMVDHEEMLRIEDTDGRILILSADIDRLKQNMMEHFPKDKDLIEEFIKSVRALTRFEIPIEKAPEVCSPIDKLKLLFKMLPFMRVLRKWTRISIQDYSARFNNPLLHETSPFVWFPEYPVIFLLVILAWMNKKVAGYPVGGSLEFSRAIERRYLDLSGKVYYNARVIKILLENDHAVGIKLEDGSEHRADYVVSAADGYTTIFNLLDGKYCGKKIRDFYNNLPLFPPLIHIALGVNRTFLDMPSSVMGLDFPLSQPVTIAGREWRRLCVRFYNFDPTLAPTGKTVLKVMFTSDYTYWKSLRENMEKYNAEKERIADQVVDILNKRFPGLAAQVEMRDVATPVTFHRYTGNWQGSFQGWLYTPKTWNLRISKSLPGLNNFYMAGQWVEPGGGLPPAALSGRNVIQIICKRDKKPFVTTIP